MNNDSSHHSASGVSGSVLSCVDLSKSYAEGAGKLDVLSGINLELGRGEMVAVIGSSGSGKSTLLNLLGGLDTPSQGSVAVAGVPLKGLSEKQLCLLRNKNMGFIYQFHHLLPEFTAVENVVMPLMIQGLKPKDAKAKAVVLLERVGLGQRLTHKPSALSGGERQRVAIARALVGEPALVLADEPTGNLDERTALSVQDLMVELNESLGITFLVVTHDSEFSSRCQRQLVLHEGRLASL
jgi:lipoprotein-releasing system ATP-binding protein